jgi:nitrogenase-stabilizing/protective protein
MPIVLPAELRDLETAEDFLAHFEIPYDRQVVHVSRLHILQRFHDYLARTDDVADEATREAAMKDLLIRAYDDFVRSDPLTERVFKVLKDAKAKTDAPPGRVFVPLSAVTGKRQPSGD